MPELVIKYKYQKTLEALLGLAKYFDFSIEIPQKSKKKIAQNIKGVTIIPADVSIDTKEMETIFSNKNIDSKSLRNKSWQRNP